MAIEGQVRVKCDAKVFDGSYRYLVLTKERYGDVTRQLGDKLPHPKQDWSKGGSRSTTLRHVWDP